MALAHQNYKTGNYKLALEHSSAVYEKNPRRTDNLILLGAIYYQELWTLSCVVLMHNKMLQRCLRRLKGVITEYLLFGYSEGGLADINQLDGLLKSLGFTQKKADSQVSWSADSRLLLSGSKDSTLKIAAAVAALHERSLIRSRIKELHFVQPLPKYQRRRKLEAK